MVPAPHLFRPERPLRIRSNPQKRTPRPDIQSEMRTRRQTGASPVGGRPSKVYFRSRREGGSGREGPDPNRGERLPFLARCPTRDGKWVLTTHLRNKGETQRHYPGPTLRHPTPGTVLPLSSCRSNPIGHRVLDGSRVVGGWDPRRENITRGDTHPSTRPNAPIFTPSRKETTTDSGDTLGTRGDEGRFTDAVWNPIIMSKISIYNDIDTYLQYVK